MPVLPVPTDDGHLVQRHLEGDPGALEVIYRRHHPRLVRLLRRRLVDVASAEDLAQDALIQATRYLKGFDVSRPLWPWLKTIAIHLAAEHARRAEREAPTDPADLQNPSAAVSSPEDREILGQALDALTPEQRLAFRLRYLEDWTPSEASDFMGLNRTALNQVLYRARQRLRNELERLGGSLKGVLVLPARTLRDVLERTASRMQRVVAGAHEGSVVATSGALQQFTAGLVAILIMGAGPAELVSPAEGRRLAQTPHDAAERRREPPSDPLERSDGERDSPNEDPPDSEEAPPSDPPPRDLAEKAERAADEVVSPNRHVAEPEDATITSFAFSPEFQTDGTVFAAGTTRCHQRLCPSVLFVSGNRGHSWKRLPAVGFDGEELLLPPEFGSEDARIFAMGPTGLHVSSDGGASFTPAAPGAASAVGPAAVSPQFHEGDPTILIGGPALMRYRDDHRVVEPALSSATAGPLFPAYSPTYAEDGLTFLGGLALDPLQNRRETVVFRCRDGLCSEVGLGSDAEWPEIRTSSEFRRDAPLFAFTERSVFRSIDRGVTFVPASVPTAAGRLVDLLVRDKRGLLAALAPYRHGEKRAGLFSSSDRGASWSRIDNELLSGGVEVIAEHHGTLIAGLTQGGIACSVDGGASWSRRCPAFA